MSARETTPQMETRARLLEAAGRIFADRGLHQATIREICDQAGANVAAVNYYFHGKDDLYAEVLMSWAKKAFEKFPPLLGLPAAAAPEERLRAFVSSFLLRLLDPGRPAWHGRLIAREMAEPTHAFETLMSSYLLPTIQTLEAIVRDLLGPDAQAVAVNRLMASIIGQILFYQHSRPVLERLAGPRRWDSAAIELLATHITSFSLAGIKQIRAELAAQAGG